MQNRIEQLLDEQNMTQKQLAHLLGISQKEVSHYKNGVTALPLDILLHMRVIFNASIDYIVGISPVRNPDIITPETLSEWVKPKSRPLSSLDLYRIFSQLSDANRYIAQGMLLSLLTVQDQSMNPMDVRYTLRETAEIK